MSRERRGPYLKPRPRQRIAKSPILIYVEGEKTEAQYFRALKRDEQVTEELAITVRSAKGGAAEGIIEAAKTYVRGANREFDEVWCVLDADKSGGKTLTELKKIAMIGDEAMKLVFSNPCFEAWLLLHFADRSRSYSDCSKVRRQVSREWKKHFNKKYDKSAPDIFARLAPKLDTAIANARGFLEAGGSNCSAFDCNSSSEVYRLVERLRQ